MMHDNAKEQTLKYCLYARKSSESDERQAMSIDSQLTEMRGMAQLQGLNVVDELQESHSAKDSGQRPLYNELMQGLKNGKYNAVLTWAPDRLSRNAGDLGAIVDLMDQGKLLHIRTYSQTFSNNPNEKFLLMILCSQAKLENDNKSINVKRGIRAKCEMGWRPGTAPLGYINRSFGGVNDIIPDPERADIITEMFYKAADGWSGRKLKTWLDTKAITTRTGKQVPLSSILAMLLNPFYYGEFQYPEGPDQPWYKGAHKPLITKELFDKIQETRHVWKGIWGSKDFIFKAKFQCGMCGTLIIGQEKYKKQKDGSFKRHIYYTCSGRTKRNCKQPYINEVDLCNILQDFIEQNYKKISLNSNIIEVISRHQEASKLLMTRYAVELELAHPLVEYGRYVLSKGSDDEKSFLVSGIASVLILKDKVMMVGNSKF
ncbi:MAG: recombinase family protein [Candidatus Microsaccharimonas sp.]